MSSTVETWVLPKGPPFMLKKIAKGEQILIAEIDKPKKHGLWHRCWASPNRSPNPQSLNINPNLYLGCGASGNARKLRFEGFGHPGGPKSLNLRFLPPPRGPKSLNLGFLALQNPKNLNINLYLGFLGPRESQKA